jgi:Fe2+ or Zn2+ uptake regulation protein
MVNCESCLKENKIKITRGRVVILNIIYNSMEPITAESIYEKSVDQGNNIDLSTVYRSLELFASKNIVDKFDLGDGKYNYKIKEYKHKHKIECSCCHKKVEIDCPMIPIEELIKNKTGFVLLEHELKMKAVCQECLKKLSEAKKQ